MEFTDVVNVEYCDNLHKVLKDKSHKIILAVPIESCHLNRKRHLVVISAPAEKQKQLHPKSHGGMNTSRSQSFTCKMGRMRSSSAYMKMVRNSGAVDLDYCMLGVDTFMQEGKDIFRLGFVLKILWGTEITLDGDGGFGVHSLQKHFMFKTVSLQSLWTTIQSLHVICARLKPKRKSFGIVELDWVRDYQEAINSPQSCINEWNEMPDILSRRPPSPDELSVLSDDAASTEAKKIVMKSKLRDIMKTVDLDDITSKSIRLKLEADLNQKLEEFKAFIDEEILLILGQMDPASKIFDFMYLGSEWNASNLEELNANGITHILNITREIDNFFPAVFKYLNIREYDVEETDLLKYWEETYNFVVGCAQMGGRVLVHCKMGISRSASTVCAFAMKHFGWPLEQALLYTKEKRSIINPNQGFRHQLSVYEGILEASRQRNSFRKYNRSKSESHVQCKEESESEDDIETRVVDKSEDISTSKKVHCYSKLATYFSKLQATPSTSTSTHHTSDKGARQGTTRGTDKNTNRLSEDEKETDAKKAEMTRCPAKSHLNQCTCNLEVELRVSEKPVDIFEQTPETDDLLKNLGNFPIHIRQAQKWTTPKHDCLEDVTQLSEVPSKNADNTKIGDVDFPVINKEDLKIKIKPETAKAKVLSVKTLADMFDFRLGDNIKHIKEDKIINKITKNKSSCTEC